MKSIRDIMEWFDSHEEEFNACVEELDDINNVLGNDRYYLMDFIGHDEDEIVSKNGERRFAPFNPARKYFYIGKSGKLISSDRKDYTDYLNDFTIAALRRNRDQIPTIQGNRELKEMFEE